MPKTPRPIAIGVRLRLNQRRVAVTMATIMKADLHDSLHEVNVSWIFNGRAVVKDSLRRGIVEVGERSDLI